MAPPARLSVVPLEDRSTPAAFGIPWTHGTDITISFPADGAAVLGSKSTAFADMAADGYATPAAWQGEILRAFETWAKEANINVGVVADNNAAMGTPGLPEGDTRFGDVRVFARPLADTVLAVTTPPGPATLTEAGDIVINSNVAFGTGAGKYDLYTAMLQEAGHALGVGNSTAATSAMFETYQGTRVGVSAADALSVRALYGPRAPDLFEGTGNSTFAAATALATAADTTTRFAQGDLTSSTDIDTYKFTTGSSVSKGVTVTLTAGGVSLVAAAVTVSNAAGTQVAAAAAVGPGGDLSVTVPNAQKNATYYVQVTAAAGTAYAVGGYQLRVVTDPSAKDPLPPPAAPVYLSDPGGGQGNDTAATATALAATSGTTSQAHYEVFGKLDLSADKDVYKVTSPVLPPGVTTTLLVRVLPGEGFIAAAPRILTADGQPAAYEVIATEGAQRIVQLKNVPSNATFYVEVSRTGAAGAADTYQMTADFRPTGVTFDAAAAGTLTPTATAAYSTIQVNRAQVLALSLTAQNLTATGAAAVWLQLYRVGNKTPYSTWIATPGSPACDNVYVEPGEYVLKVSTTYFSVPTSLSSLASLLTPPAAAGNTSYAVSLLSLTDPIGIAPVNPGGTTTVAPPPADWTYIVNPFSYYSWLTA